MARTGIPVSFTGSRFRSLGEKRGRRYYDTVTGRTISRSSYQKYLTRVYGFHDTADYYAFSRMFPGGLGGLEGLSPRDVSRVRTILLAEEKKQGLPAGTLGQNAVPFTPGKPMNHNTRLLGWARSFLEGETGHDKKVALNHFLDIAGIRQYTSKYLPGETP